MAKPKVVFDTNVFVSALLTPHGLSARLFQPQVLDCYILLASPAIIREVAAVLSRPEVLEPTELREVEADRLVGVVAQAFLVFPTEKVTVSRDPQDNKFLEAALAGGADYLVTGDQDLQSLDGYEGIKIRSPREFLSEIGAI